jgi:hypothetical protein
MVKFMIKNGGCDNVDEIIKEITPRLGIPSIVVPIILLIFKLSPITSLFFSPIELKLSTKEKRAFVTAIKVGSEVILYVFFLLGITAKFIIDKNIFNPIIAIIIVIFVFVVLIWTFKLKSNQQTLFKIQNNKIYQFLLFLLFLIHCACIFILPAYYLGTQLYPLAHTKREQLYCFYFIITFYFFYTVEIREEIRMYKNLLSFGSNRNIDLKVRIQYDDWFILHPIEKELYLLGNNSDINKCTQVIEKKELLQNNIKVINNNR